MRDSGLIRRLTAGAAVLAVSGGATMLGVAAADAAPPQGDGPLTATPATGTDKTIVTLRTPAGCPTTANAYNGLVKGPNGFDSTVVNTLSDGISFTDPFSVKFSNSMLLVSQFSRKPIVAGEYDIFLNCVDDFTGQVFRSFTTAMYFTDATHYSLDPTATPETGMSDDGARGTTSEPSAAWRTRTSSETSTPIGLIVIGSAVILVAVVTLVVWLQRRGKRL